MRKTLARGEGRLKLRWGGVGLVLLGIVGGVTLLARWPQADGLTPPPSPPDTCGQP